MTPEEMGFRVLNRVEWAAVNGDIKNVTRFQVDVYKFRFPEGMERDMAISFMSYLKSLDMRRLDSIVKTYAWLKQNNVKFHMSFGWNRRLPIRYNLEHFTYPMRIRKLIEGCDKEDVLTYELEQSRKGKQDVER